MWPIKPSPQSLIGPTGIIFILLSSCVSISTYKKEIKQTKIETWQKARKIAYYQKCEDAVQMISGRIDVEEIKP